MSARTNPFSAPWRFAGFRPRRATRSSARTAVGGRGLRARRAHHHRNPGQGRRVVPGAARNLSRRHQVAEPLAHQRRRIHGPGAARVDERRQAGRAACSAGRCLARCSGRTRSCPAARGSRGSRLRPGSSRRPPPRAPTHARPPRPGGVSTTMTSHSCAAPSRTQPPAARRGDGPPTSTPPRATGRRRAPRRAFSGMGDTTGARASAACRGRGRSTLRRARPKRRPATPAEPCGSRSTRSARRSSSASAAARFTAVVVFPTPPLRLTTAIACTPPFCHARAARLSQPPATGAATQ